MAATDEKLRHQTTKSTDCPPTPTPTSLHSEKTRQRMPRFGKKTWRYRWDFTRPFDQHVTALGYVRPNACGKIAPWITPHTMRHTFASLLLSEEVSVYSVAKWMGDEVRTVKSNYGHLLPGHDQIERAFSGRAKGQEREGAVILLSSADPAP